MSQQENSKTRPYLMNDGKQSINIIILLNSTMIIERCLIIFYLPNIAHTQRIL